MDKIVFIDNNNYSHYFIGGSKMSLDRLEKFSSVPTKKYRFEPTWWHIGLSAAAIFILPLALAALLV